jgi:hypothetical protein
MGFFAPCQHKVIRLQILLAKNFPLLEVEAFNAIVEN